MFADSGFRMVNDMSRIIKYTKKQKHGRFLAYCERQITEVGSAHRDDLIADAQTTKGRPMLCGVPCKRSLHYTLMNDSQKRFVKLSDGVYGLAQKEVEECPNR